MTRPALILLLVLPGVVARAGESALQPGDLPGDASFYRDNFDRIRLLLQWHAGVRFGPSRLAPAESADVEFVIPDEDAAARQVDALCRALLTAGRRGDALPDWTIHLDETLIEAVQRDFSPATAAWAKRYAAIADDAWRQADPDGRSLDPFATGSGQAVARAGKRRALLAEHTEAYGPDLLRRSIRWAGVYSVAADAPSHQVFVHRLSDAAGENLFAFYRARGADVPHFALGPIVTDTWPPRDAVSVPTETAITLGVSRPVKLADEAIRVAAATRTSRLHRYRVNAHYDEDQSAIVVALNERLLEGAEVNVRLAARKVLDAETRLPLDGNGNGRRDDEDDALLTFSTRHTDDRTQPPAVSQPPRELTTVRARRVMVFSIDAIDPAGAPLQIKTVDLPKEAAFDPHTRIVRWPTTLDDVGQCRVTFRVSNGLKQTAPLAVTLSVLPDPTVP
ncbi:MAG: hypothetical protein GVY16_09290 [Planctomycetes bacterium]|nr:hypothetical protein [Phycisphaerae bacterium]NBB95917.1 hypothetical protein [Planctomycetota bacterium]